jgi:hypothetical protein
MEVMDVAFYIVLYRQSVCKRTNRVVADVLRLAFKMLTEANDREVGRKTQSALTPHLASLIVPDRVLCSGYARIPKRDLMLVTLHP